MCVGRGLPAHSPQPTAASPRCRHRRPTHPPLLRSPYPTPGGGHARSPPGVPLRAGKHALALLVPKDDGKKAAPGKKGIAKKIVAKKIAAKNAPAKKVPAKKIAAKQATTKKAAAKQSAATKET